jgi:hypothetical protein
MIHGKVQDGAILPLDPIPADWDGQDVIIEAAVDKLADEEAEIERWYAELQALGPAQHEPGERDAVQKAMAEADREAKEYVRRTWARFDDTLPAGYESPERGTER